MTDPHNQALNAFSDDDNSEEHNTGIQIVSFEIADEVFAFNMQSVLEIIRVPVSVAVPLTPDTLVGLANLRGGVLPVIDLRLLLGLTCKDNDDHTRVVVVDSGKQGRVGLIVDRVSQVKTVDKASIETNVNIDSAHKDLIQGIIKTGDGAPVVQMLDAVNTLSGEFSDIVSKHIDRVVETGESPSSDDDEDLDNQLVSFTVNNQEYAFDLMSVEEIVRVPNTIAQVPQAGTHIVGIIELRGKLLPLLCLRTMMQMPAQDYDDATRIVIVSVLGVDGERMYGGFIVDQMREVLRVSDDEIEALPSIMQKNNDEQISNICQLENGQRLVSILSAGHLFGHPVMQQALSQAQQAGEENYMQDIQQNDDSSIDDEHDDNTEQLVVFLLEKQEYAISIDHVQEITRVPEKLDKVPKTQSFVEGLVNLRGTVLPVLDMRSRFRIDKMDNNDRQRIIVLSQNNVRTGFIVDAVLQVLRLPKGQIEAAPNLSEEQSRVMGKVVNLKDDKRIIQVLDVNELLSDSEINALTEVA